MSYYIFAAFFLFALISYMDEIARELNPELTKKQRVRIQVKAFIVMFFIYAIPEVWAMR